MNDLNHRIATEFMEYKWTDCKYLTYKDWHDKEGNRISSLIRNKLCDFSPTTDIKDAYLVLEKIASKLTHINIFPGSDNALIASKGMWVIWLLDEHNFHIVEPTLPLAISKLAEKIMDTPELMEMFR